MDVSRCQAIPYIAAYHFEARRRCGQTPIGYMDVPQTHPLELIVRGTPHVLVGVLDLTHHPIRSAPLAQPQHEPIPQPFNRTFPFEGGKSSVEHQSNGIDELARVGS